MTDSPVVQAMKAEIVALERKLTRLREALAEYKGAAPPVPAPERIKRRKLNGAGHEGYKLVPLRKVDRIRIGARDFLRVQPGHKAHRSAVAEHLPPLRVLGDITN